MTVGTDSIRALLAGRNESILREHRAGASGFATCVALAGEADAAIRSLFLALPGNDHNDIAILALGGYGRAELCPKSDIDVMVLRKDDDKTAETAKKFLHLLWNAGLNVGHSVRTIDEALSLHGNTLDAWASMLESRFVCGNEKLASSFHEQMSDRVSLGNDTWLINGIFVDAEKRHERYGNSVKLLEPNIKSSAGGLRDFHAIFWLYRGTKPSYFSTIAPGVTASAQFLDQLLADGRIEHAMHAETAAALQFLFRVRHEMHVRRGSAHDILEYALQREVAQGLSPKEESANGNQGNREMDVEAFMRKYYLNARAIHRFHQQLGHPFKETIEPRHTESSGAESIGNLFSLFEGFLSIKADIQELENPQHILEAFVHSAENDAEPDFRLRAVIERSLSTITEADRQSPAMASLFRRILNSRRVATTLRTMNDLGVLGKYIPEFEDLVAFFQHNVYHYFTADEHTLIALAHAERLREEQGVMREVFRNLRRKDVLYLSILLHDIAKPRGVADHEITGVDMATTILKRLEMDDAIPDVAFLVRNHLLMEQIAFRRNIHDPETIKEFAAKFKNPEQLDYLYLLTYADLSAVNINVWTEWKSVMLQDLYRQTSEVLRRNLRGAQIDSYHHSRRDAATADLVERLSSTIPREQIERHLGGIQNEAYVALFSEQEIAEHILKSEAKEPVSTLFSHEEGYTEVTVIAYDAPFALSRFCAVLTANDANIFDANIFTRNDGVIIDRFRVAATSTQRHLEQRTCTKIGEDLKQVVVGKLDVEHLFEAHRRKWKRVQKMPINPNVRIDVEFEDNPAYTIIDVYAPDSVGFLYRITETMSDLGLNIFFAKIATRGDGIVDAFYTRDASGKPVTDPASRESIRSEILKTIRDIQQQELA